MVKDNTPFIASIGSFSTFAGVIWAIGLAVKEEPSYFYLAIASLLIVAGVLTILFSMRTEKWITA